MKKIFSTPIQTVVVALLLVVLSLGILAPVTAHATSSTNYHTTTQNNATQTAPKLIAQTNPSTLFAQSTSTTIPSAPKTCENSFVGLGWLLCQITDIVYSAFEWLIDSILADRLLKVEILDNNDALLRTWSNFRFLANILFAIVFMVIIYAEASGRIGALETYSVGRLLPRLALAVIGLNLSYFIMGYAIDFFNDMGKGVAELVLLPVKDEGSFQFSGLFQPLTDGTQFFGIPLDGAGDAVDNIVVGMGALGVGIAGIVFLPTLLSFGVLGLILLLLTLIARKILIVALVVLSPFAFAMFVLPATNKYFKQWWDLFLKALLMYPLIMVFIASGALLGRLQLSGSDPSFFNSIVAFIATFLPFFLIPLTFRLAGSGIAAIAGGIGNANEKIKGDMRDPNSVRSILKQKRGQNYSRLMNGQARMPVTNKPVVPRGIRRIYNRIPGTDTMAPMIDSISSGRKMVESITQTMSDDAIRAMAVTGGGKRVGSRVKVQNGNGFAYMQSGYAKLGKHIAYQDGRVVTDENGAARILNSDGSIGRAAKVGDFYDKDIMADVSKNANNLGYAHAASEHTMTKAINQRDQAQVWEGLDASKWTKDEKTGIAQGVWFNTKNDHLHHKFADFGGYFHDGSYDVAGDHRAMSLKFTDLAQYVDEQSDSYSLSKQKGAFWKTAQSGLESFADVKGVDASMAPDVLKARVNSSTGGMESNTNRYDQITNLAWKANSFINSSRRRGGMMHAEQGEDGEVVAQIAGSQSAGEAAREAEKFLQLYKKRFGYLPQPSGIDKELLP